jgi:ParB family chromosome partitioning protein
MSDLDQDFRAGARKRGLGKGLSVLLGAAGEAYGADAPGTGSGVRTVPVELLQPSPLQPRRRFAEEELAQLADSIRAKGVMQPLLVRRRPGEPGHYEIVAGERRWRAAQRAGVHELPVVVHELADRDALEVALLENVQRQDLSPLEEAEGYQRLIDEFGHTQQALAEALGKSRSHIANLLRLLALPPQVRTMVEEGALSAGHARALLMAQDPLRLARMVVARGLNVRQTEALVKAERTRAGAPTERAAKGPDMIALERELSSQLGLAVNLTTRGDGGVLSIAYRSLDQLDGLLKRLR